MSYKHEQKEHMSMQIPSHQVTWQIPSNTSNTRFFPTDGERVSKSFLGAYNLHKKEEVCYLMLTQV